jgi:hypothetical protein
VLVGDIGITAEKILWKTRSSKATLSNGETLSGAPAFAGGPVVGTGDGTDAGKSGLDGPTTPKGVAPNPGSDGPAGVDGDCPGRAANISFANFVREPTSGNPAGGWPPAAGPLAAAASESRVVTPPLESGVGMILTDLDILQHTKRIVRQDRE